jgi:hypothetical protein
MTCNYSHSLVGFCMKCGWSHTAVDPERLAHLEAQVTDLQTRNSELVEMKRKAELILKQTEESRQMWMTKCQEKSDDKADALQELEDLKAACREMLHWVIGASTKQFVDIDKLRKLSR